MNRDVIDLSGDADPPAPQPQAEQKVVRRQKKKGHKNRREVKFRFNAKHLLLTYSQVGEHIYDEFINHIRCVCNEWGISLKSWCGATEHHTDGGQHIHIGLKFSTKPNISDCELFDYPCWDCPVGSHKRPLHPNWRSKRNRNAWERIWCYINKEGHAGGDDLPLPLSFRGFSRANQDKKEWLLEAKSQHAVSPFPFPWPDFESTCQAPTGYQREYIYIIFGQPNSGKTWWRTSKLHDYFRPQDPKYPMEGYGGEQLIVYDDFEFNEHKGVKPLLIGNGSYESNTPALVGTTRYHKVYYPIKQQRIVIIITNDKYGWMSDEWFTTRVAGVYRMMTDASENDWVNLSDI